MIVESPIDGPTASLPRLVRTPAGPGLLFLAGAAGEEAVRLRRYLDGRPAWAGRDLNGESVLRMAQLVVERAARGDGYEPVTVDAAPCFDWLTAEQVGEHTGVGAPAVRRAIREHRLPPTLCHQVGITWLIHPTALSYLKDIR